MTDPPAVSHRWGRIVLLGWWGMMFLATHLPIPPGSGEGPLPDKLIHFLMYAVLGGLLPLWRGWSHPLTGRALSALFATASVYGALDELLQVPVGRTAEWGDWLCDLAGSAAGLLLAALLQRCLSSLTASCRIRGRRNRGTTRSAG